MHAYTGTCTSGVHSVHVIEIFRAHIKSHLFGTNNTQSGLYVCSRTYLEGGCARESFTLSIVPIYLKVLNEFNMIEETMPHYWMVFLIHMQVHVSEWKPRVSTKIKSCA